MYEYSLFLLLKEIDVIPLFAGKKFEVIRVVKWNCNGVDESTNRTW